VSPLRIGILGAARIAPIAVVRPARELAGVEVHAVAARDPERAREHAAHYGITHVAPTYRALIERDDLDAIYIALPAAAHFEWSVAALRAGKHVLCEKPVATSVAQAEELVAVANAEGRLMVEAYHYVYHPYFARIRELVSQDLGDIESIEALHSNWVPRDWPVYWSAELGGGAMFHLGGYLVHCVRSLTQAPLTVDAVSATWLDGVDTTVDATLTLAQIHTSMCREDGFENWLRVQGTRGTLHAVNFIVPHYGPAKGASEARLRLDVVGRPPMVEPAESRSTYLYQLEAFVAAVRDGTALPTTGRDIIDTMRVIEAIRTHG